MERSKIIKDHRGTVRISVKLVTFGYGKDIHGNEYRYDVTEWHTPPRKRNEINNVGIATKQEIYDAKRELWEALKPTQHTP